jgi:hypothetical protein
MHGAANIKQENIFLFCVINMQYFDIWINLPESRIIISDHKTYKN